MRHDCATLRDDPRSLSRQRIRYSLVSASFPFGFYGNDARRGEDQIEDKHLCALSVGSAHVSGENAVKAGQLNYENEYDQSLSQMSSRSICNPNDEKGE